MSSSCGEEQHWKKRVELNSRSGILSVELNSRRPHLLWGTVIIDMLSEKTKIYKIYKEAWFCKKGGFSIYEQILVREMSKSAYKTQYLETLKTVGRSIESTYGFI